MNDRNADLIGFEFPADDGGTYRVTGTWNDGPPGYVLAKSADGTHSIVRQASVVRRSKELS